MSDQTIGIPKSVVACWLVRGPGMALKVVLCETEAQESVVRQVYRQSINCRRTEVDIDPDIEWPECKVVPKDELMRTYPHLLQYSTQTGEQPRVLWIRKTVK